MTEEHPPRPPRFRTYLAGVVIHGPSAVTMDCVVRNISDGGARVALVNIGQVAPPAVLLIPKRDEAYHAAVAWQAGHEVGFRFLNRIDLASPGSDIEALARRIWVERGER